MSIQAPPQPPATAPPSAAPRPGPGRARKCQALPAEQVVLGADRRARHDLAAVLFVIPFYAVLAIGEGKLNVKTEVADRGL